MIQIKHLVLTFCAVALSMCASGAVRAQQDDDHQLQTEQLIENTNLWVVYLKVEVLRDYLKYPRSYLASPTVVSVAYRRKEPGTGWGPFLRYEEFWYHNGMPIGLHRTSMFPYRQQSGSIYIMPGSLLKDHTDAVANAVVRVLSEVLAARAIVSMVYVPHELFEQFENEFARMKFRQFTQVRIGDRPVILHITSYPPGQDKYLYHESGEKPLLN